MSEIISKYFRTSQKRPASASSSDSSPDSSSRPRQQEKRRLVHQESNSCEEDDMAVTLEDIQAQLATLATKEDVAQIRSDLDKSNEKLSDKMEKLEARFYDLEKEIDSLKDALSSVRKENGDLRGRLSQQDKQIEQLKSELNNKEQYDRRWNLRVYNVPEEKDETADQCATKCCKVFTELIGVTTKESDVEVAHRTGPPAPGRKRPIIVRFHSRKVKDQVLMNRRKLKNKGVSVGEDLTPANYRLLRDAHKHSFTLASWSSQGKIFAKLKNGKTVNIRYGANVEELMKKEMSDK